MSKGCELCSINEARIVCESDEARLCWDCDEKVHGANFLVAKHSRALLCDLCQSPTPWSAAGPNLGRTVSVCHACAHRSDHSPETSDDYSYSDDDDESSWEEDGENQVVPLSSWDSVSKSEIPISDQSLSSEDTTCWSEEEEEEEENYM